ncbi:alpha/beta hydrolase [Pseudonocardia xishanensis]|uniref:Alpha/beta hydrolase n=1 Tax=Pseudonocardia xishanensis TaxID=630995 RepID=A0ABP8RUU9_9PSEU
MNTTTDAAYPYDPELARIVPTLPVLDPTHLSATRKLMADMFAGMPAPDTTGIDVTERSVPGPEGAPDVTLRIYRPEQRTTDGVIYNVHGGGLILGDLDTDHARNVSLCRELGTVLVSVDYRLAPEHPYPAGLEDAYAGLVWTAANAAELGVDPQRLVLHGASAGGNLCAALALLARDRGGPAVVFQFLGVPQVDDRLDTPSMALTDVPFWTPEAFATAWRYYIGHLEGDVPGYAVPLRAEDLSGLPAAYISVMHLDPLRDGGLAYAQALLQAGVTVELHLFPGTFHGSVFADQTAVSQRELDEELAVLRAALSS